MLTDTCSKQSIYDIVQLLDELPPGVDPDFDTCREDLEFEFAALRLTLETN